MKRKEKRTLTQQRRDRLALKLAGGIAEILTLVIQEIVKEDQEGRQ